MLEGARLGRTEVRAGEMLEVEATVHPYQAEARVVRVKVKLPETLTAGPMRIVVSDGATLDRLTMPGGAGTGGGSGASGGAGRRGGADEPESLERPRVCDAAGSRASGGAGCGVAAGSAAFDGECAGAAEGGAEDAVDGGRAWVEAGSMETGYAVTGSQVLTVAVR